MLVLMNVQATPEQVANVIKHVRERGFEPIETQVAGDERAHAAGGHQ